MKQLYNTIETVNRNFSQEHAEGDMFMRKVLKKTFSSEIDLAVRGTESP